MGLLHEEVNTPIYRTWKRALEVIPEAHLSHGLRKATNHKGFFNLPAFVLLCNPQMDDYGLPDPEAAFNDACSATSPISEYKFLHPAVYHAAADTGWAEIRLGKGKNAFKHNYKTRCNQVMGGIVLTIPKPELLESKIEKKPENEEIRKHVNNLKALFGE